METLSPEDWRVHGFVIFGTDGSKVEVPRTKSNQQAYAHSRQNSKSNRRIKPHDRAATKKTEQPQLFLMSMFHVGLNLPWVSLLEQHPELVLLIVANGLTH